MYLHIYTYIHSWPDLLPFFLLVRLGMALARGLTEVLLGFVIDWLSLYIRVV